MPTDLYIDNLGVTSNKKREGLGTRLVLAIMDWGLENGCRAAWLGTETDNEEARRFYESFGFIADTIAYYVAKPAAFDAPTPRAMTDE